MSKGYTYNSKTNTYEIHTSVKYGDLKSLIESAKGGETFKFDAGKFSFGGTGKGGIADNAIYIKSDNITITGTTDKNGKNLTDIELTNPHAAQLFNATTDHFGTAKTPLTTTFKEGSNVLEIAATAKNIEAFKEGSYVLMGQKKAPLNNGLIPVETFFAKIEDVKTTKNGTLLISASLPNADGSSKALASPYTFDPQKTTVQAWEPIKNLDIANLNITGKFLPGEPDHNLFKNVKDGETYPALILAQGLDEKSSFTNLSVKNSWANVLDLKRSVGTEIDGLKMDGAYNKAGGQGYGIQLTSTFGVTAKNLEILNMRHAVLFSSVSTEAYNTVHVSYTNRDINFHGMQDKFNTVVVDKMVQEYGNSTTGTWRADHYSGGNIHVLTTNNTNITYFKELRASNHSYNGDPNLHSDRIHSHESGSFIQSGIGNDILYGGKSRDVLYGEDGNDVLFGGAGKDYLKGGNGNDKLYAGEDDDELNGGNGDDIIDGGAGNDKMWGGKGVDIMYGGDGQDDLGGGAGNDKMYGGAGHDVMRGWENDDEMYGNAGDDILHGDEGDDMVHGDDGDDMLYGEAGRDQLHGGEGNDRLSGGDGHDSLNGGDGNDRLHGGNDDDLLKGGNGDDWLYGDYGNDTLFGGDGNDLIVGGAGQDILNGGKGADVFIFADRDLRQNGPDTVTDFNLKEGDRISLDRLITTFDPVSHAIEDFVRITQVGKNSVLSVDVDGGGDRFVNIAVFNNVSGLTDESALLKNGHLIV